MKFFERTWVIWLCLFIFAPVGIFLLWKNKKYNIILRSIISFVFGAITIGAMFSSEKKEHHETKAKFEVVGIYRTDTEHRSYTVYTDTKDIEKMIEYSKKLVETTPKPNLEIIKRQIVVHFFSDREYTPQNTTLTNYFEGMWLQVSGIERYKPYMLGTYQNTFNGSELWYEGYNAVEEDIEGIPIIGGKINIESRE